MISVDVMREVKLLDGTFSPSEARDMLSGIIDKQINFYKLQHLSQWEGNHNLSCDHLDRKINELREKKQELMDVINIARMERRRVTFGGVVELSIE